MAVMGAHTSDTLEDIVTRATKVDVTVMKSIASDVEMAVVAVDMVTGATKEDDMELILLEVDAMMELAFDELMAVVVSDMVTGASEVDIAVMLILASDVASGDMVTGASKVHVGLMEFTTSDTVYVSAAAGMITGVTIVDVAVM
jgi:hypothetical protein